MKRSFTFFFSILFFILLMCGKLQAQNQVYWGEGFDSLNSELLQSTPSASVWYWAALPSGTWFLHDAHLATGTSCMTVTEPNGTDAIGSGHIRLDGKTLTADTPYVVTPILSSGVQEVHFVRNQASRNYSIYWTSDTGAIKTNNVATNWQLVVTIASSPNICSDTSIVIGEATAKRIMIAAGKGGVNYDFDSVWITSFSAITPVEFGSINGMYSNGKVKLSWSIATEIDTKEYVVERSSNGSNFAEVGKLNAKGSSRYVWIDNQPVNGNGFYRVKAVDVNGAVKYSTIVKVNSGDAAPDVNIAPNPVIGNKLNIQLNNLSAGNYALEIFNTSSQRVFSNNIIHSGGNSAQTFLLPAGISKGLYAVRLTNGATSFTKNVLIQ